MKGVKRFVKVLLKTMKYGFIVFCIYLGSLFFRDQKLPDFLIERILSSASNEQLLFLCDDAFFGFREGLRVSGFKIFERNGFRSLDPLVSARTIVVDPFRRLVQVKSLRIPRVPESSADDSPAVAAEVKPEFAMPDFPSFMLELDHPDVLGVKPASLKCLVASTVGGVSAGDIRLIWPEDGSESLLRGFCDVNLGCRMVKGEVKGSARQAQIRPLLCAFELDNVVHYVDAFTEVADVVPSYCGWEFGLDDGILRLELDFKPTMGRYNGVPMSRADGRIGVCVDAFGTNCDYNIRVGPLRSWNNDGRLMLSGEIGVRCTNGLNYIDFDAHGVTLPKELLEIAEIDDGGVLGCFETKHPVRTSARGVLSLDSGHEDETELAGRLEAGECRFMEIPFRSAAVDCRYSGDSVIFSGLNAVGVQGGKLAGSAGLHFPGGGIEGGRFKLDLRYTDGSMAEISDTFGLELSDRHGRMSAELTMSAPLVSNFWESAVATGRVEITDGMLWRMNFFDELLKALHIDRLPVVGRIGTLTDRAWGAFTIADGVMRIGKVVIDGPFVSITASGTYDLRTDWLDCIVQVNPLRSDAGSSVLPIGELVHIMSKPLTKTLEYRVTGHPDTPQWKSRWLGVILDTVKEPL